MASIKRMDKPKFWKMIDDSRTNAHGDFGLQIELLRKRMRDLPPNEIVSFQALFSDLLIDSYRWDLWAAAYLINGGCSDDGFHYFRSWLISKGESVYENALSDPESLTKVITGEDRKHGCELESFEYVASEVWQEKTGKERGEFPHSRRRQPRSPRGEEWNEDRTELQRRFPILWKEFGRS